MSIGIPEAIFLALMGLGLALTYDTRRVSGIVGRLISAAIIVGLLWWGGFFA